MADTAPSSLTSDATTPYPTHPLKEVAELVTDYALGDICLDRPPTGILTIRQLKSEKEIQDLTARRDATAIDRHHFLVIRTNEKMGAAVLMAWLSTTQGERAVQANVENSSSFRRQLRWNNLGTLRVSVPPLEDQIHQRQMLGLAVDWMDEYSVNIEHLAKTLKKLRHAMAQRIVSRPADKQEVYGWLKDLSQGGILPASSAESKAPAEPDESLVQRRRGP